ncbi:MAG TPA: fumarylacetoacetate hydrolase family protein [Geminicoccaceae bacterium]|nr:fumarylacetoacetate hydrolase family protein [Geminicoccaceae bacterium]
MSERATIAGEAIERAAESLAGARLARTRFAGLPAVCRPPDERTAYAIQDALHRRLGAAGFGPLAGHKIGCTTAVMQQFLGIGNPCAGGVFARSVHQRHGAFRHADFLRVGVECEIAVRLVQPLPAAGAPYDRQGVAAAVGACMAAIEVVDDRYEDYRSLDTPTLIADDFFNAACVLGEPVANWRELDLVRVSGRMTINGGEVGSGAGGDILDHPLAALAWLANALAGRGRSLAAGEFVLLGSVVQTRWVEVGDLVEVEIESLGGASCSFS